MDTRTVGPLGRHRRPANRDSQDAHGSRPLGRADDALAVTGNLTVALQTAAGFVSATPIADPAPTTSTINFPKGDTMANGIVAPLDGTGHESFVYKTTTSGKTTHLILDLSGYFE